MIVLAGYFQFVFVAAGPECCSRDDNKIIINIYDEGEKETTLVLAKINSRRRHTKLGKAPSNSEKLLLKIQNEAKIQKWACQLGKARNKLIDSTYKEFSVFN